MGGDRESDSEKLVAAIRELETAALVARVPRVAVVPYAQLAAAGLWHQHNEVELNDEVERRGFENSIADAITDAAEIVSRAAWSPPATRWLWLRRWAANNAITGRSPTRELRGTARARYPSFPRSATSFSGGSNP